MLIDNRFFNKFYGEIKPIQILTSLIKFSSVEIKSSNGPIDAILCRDEKQVRVQCTFAIDGRHRELELEHYNIYGSFPLKLEP